MCVAGGTTPALPVIHLHPSSDLEIAGDNGKDSSPLEYFTSIPTKKIAACLS